MFQCNQKSVDCLACVFWSQGIWLRHCGHVDPKHADPSSSKSSLRVCYHGQDMPRACGGMPSVCLCEFMQSLKSNCIIDCIRLTQCHGYMQCILLSYFTTVRVYHILPAMGSGPNGHHPQKEVDWLQQHFVVRCQPHLSPSLSYQFDKTVVFIQWSSKEIENRIFLK